MPICKRCNERPVEEFVPLSSDDDCHNGFCSRCNDALIEEANERREWRYYHSEGY